MPNGRIAKPDRTVRFDDHVVRRIETLAAITIGQHGDRAVVFGARDAARQMLAAHESALAVARMAVRIIRRLTERADRAARFVPTQDAVVGDVAPQQIAAVAEPDRPSDQRAP